jgi:putative CocE/NonD family hydrolase
MNAKVQMLTIALRKCHSFMCIEKVHTLLCAIAVTALLFISYANAQDRMSRPGVYSGYSRMLYKEIVHNSQYLTMRDGIKLAATIYRPAVAGKAVETPYPVIWEGTTSRGRRNPDGSVRFMSSNPRAAEQSRLSLIDIVKFGYVLVQVERRGQGASMGFMRGYHDWTESLDAYDITEWLARQSWSSGNIGVFGCSNTGEAALHAPTAMPPHLKAVFAGCYSWNKFDGFFRGGILANWGTGPQTSPISAGRTAVPVDEDVDGSMLEEAIRQHEKQVSLLALWKSMPFRDSWSDLVESRFWQEGSVSTYQNAMERTGVGIYSYGGWYDDFRREAFVAQNTLHNQSKLLVGPWGHCQEQGFDLVTERLRFFDYWLKNIDNGIMEEPPIYYYTVGAPEGTEWRFSSQWPLSEEISTPYYFQPDRELGTKAPTSTDGRDNYLVNYDVNCATPVGFGQTCVLDAKGITYTTKPLATSLESTGHPIVHLWIISTSGDANFFAYLEDIAPDGNASIITDGRLKGSLRALGTPPYSVFGLPWHRSFQEDAMAFEPGQPAEVVIDCLPMSHVFASGHRIRLTITGADPREKDRTQTSPPPTITIHRDAIHSSYITLPIIHTVDDLQSINLQSQ